MKWLQAIAVLAGGLLAGWLVGMGTWENRRSDLLVFIGIYAAALIQVAVTTANLNLPDFLTVEEARKLSRSLLQQQKYWIGLFGALVFFALLITLAPAVVKKISPIEFEGVLSISFNAITSGLLGAVLSFVVFHSFIFLGGLLSIQRLRSMLLEMGAARRAMAEVAKVKEVTGAKPMKTPEGYGEIIRPH